MMQLRLSCYKCGCTEFEETGIKGLINIEEKKLNIVTGEKDIFKYSYLEFENVKDNQVKCKNCGLKDYISNLPIKFI